MHNPVLLAVAHGSADPRASATIAGLMAMVAERAGSRGPELRTAFLGHAPPSLPQAMSTITGERDVRVLPLLLTAAYHSKADIPRMLARAASDFPRLRVSYGSTLGPHPLLLRALERRLAEVDGSVTGTRQDQARTGVVLASAGSTDPEANLTIARLAARWQASAGWWAVRTGYASASGPSPAEAVADLLRDGAPRVVVASYLLAPGLFADRIRRTCLAAGAAAVSPVLGAAPEVAGVLLDRYAEADTLGQTAA
jgi:sirohydrochlorin ferrochelatase